MDKIKLVQGDTLPALVVSVVDKDTGDPLDVSEATSLFKFRQVGSSVVKDTITCGKLPGWKNPDGDIITTAPYDTPGKGGRLIVYWNPTSLDTIGEFEGEVEVTFLNGKVQTIYEVIKFAVRPQL